MVRSLQILYTSYLKVALLIDYIKYLIIVYCYAFNLK